MEKVQYTVKLGFSRITSSALVEKGRNCVKMLTGNPAFTTPVPTLASITAACNALDAANQAYDFTRSRLDKEARATGFAALKLMIKELGGYVTALSAADKDLILSAGFEVEKSRQPIGKLPAPVDVRADVTLYPGRIDVRWKGVAGRSFYILEMREDVDGAQWEQVLLTTKNRYTAEGLTSNSLYSFRVTAMGAAGASPVSDFASAKAA
ncbi:MAG: fibronectin type III domain-containing protein [Flavobacteriales bacterium]|nr:fibronectin type III domain-containing protein [Flavobacteriales bacterium]